MRVVPVVVWWAMSAVVVTIGACTAESPKTPAEGEGEGEGGGEGEGEGEPCGGGCGADERCGSIFGPDAEPACFATCSDGNAPCTTATNLEGACRVIEGFDGPVCRAQVADLAPCGNAANAGCAGDDAVCAFFPDPVLFPDGGGVCVSGCETDADCGDAALGCTNDLRVRIGGVVQGVCVPANSVVDSACGRVAGELVLCTGGLTCFIEDDAVEGFCGEVPEEP